MLPGRNQPERIRGDTERRLLEAAGQVFALRGFAATRVREICSRAGANIAAVNYHFGDKEGLYAAVISDAYESAIRQFPPHGGLTADDPGDKRLLAFVFSFVSRILHRGRPAWLGQLLSWEMVQPTESLAMLIERSIRPQMKLLGEIVSQIGEGRLTEEQVRLTCLSIVAQCVFYKHAAPVMQRMGPGFHFEERDIERITDHITESSLAAIRTAARRGRAGGGRGTRGTRRKAARS